MTPHAALARQLGGARLALADSRTERCCHPVHGVEEPHRVGTADPHPALPRQPRHAILQYRLLATLLGKTGGQHKCGAHAGCGAFLQHVHHPLGRDGDDRKVDRCPHGRDGGIAAMAGNLRSACRDRIQQAGKPGGHDLVEQGSAYLSAVRGRANHGDGGGRQQRPQWAWHHGLCGAHRTVPGNSARPATGRRACRIVPLSDSVMNKDRRSAPP